MKIFRVGINVDYYDGIDDVQVKFFQDDYAANKYANQLSKEFLKSAFVLIEDQTHKCELCGSDVHYNRVRKVFVEEIEVE